MQSIVLIFIFDLNLVANKNFLETINFSILLKMLCILLSITMSLIQISLLS